MTHEPSSSEALEALRRRLEQTPGVGDVVLVEGCDRPEHEHLVVACRVGGSYAVAATDGCEGLHWAGLAHPDTDPRITRRITRIVRRASYEDVPEPEPEYEIGALYAVRSRGDMWFIRRYIGGEHPWGDPGDTVGWHRDTFREVRGPLPVSDLDALPAVRGGAA